MDKLENNPLTPLILQVLIAHPEKLAIHELLQKIKAQSPLPRFDENEQLALFKLNWLMMNALYQLQTVWYEQGYYLHISTLDIHLAPLQQGQSHVQAISRAALREYYLNKENFSQTTVDDVQALLDGLWLNYFSQEQCASAYQCLDLQPHASMQQIKQRYRQLANQHHPDKGGDKEMFMQIRQAYEVLLKGKA